MMPTGYEQNEIRDNDNSSFGNNSDQSLSKGSAPGQADTTSNGGGANGDPGQTPDGESGQMDGGPGGDAGSQYAGCNNNRQQSRR